MSSIRRLANRVVHETPLVLPTVGDMKHSAVDEDHIGWLKCDGRLLERDAYPMLFGRIGTAFGSSGTQFRLPDPRGRVIGVIGAGAGLTVRAMGDAVGTETHTLTIAEMPAHKHGAVDVSGNTNGSGVTDLSGNHTHTINDPEHSHTLGDIPQGTQNIRSVASGIAADDATAADEVRYTGTTSSSATGITINANGTHAHLIASTGGSQPHNNMQPTLFAGHLYIFAGGHTYSSLA
jgi:microcystin-dependent protein